MKIVQIMPEFGLAGAETMCENLTYELVKMGHEVIVVSLYDFHSAITDRLEESGVIIKYLSKKPGIDISIISKLRLLFKKEKPDVIHTHRYVMQYAIPAAIMSGIKARVHTVHNVALKENDKPARILAKFFYKFCNVVPVALSSEIQKTILDEYKLKPKDVPIILNGINLSKCIPKENYLCNDSIKILHIGRFSEQKNHVILIEAFRLFHANNKSSRLELIGDGEKKDEIKELVKKCKLENCVDFLGLQKNVYAYLHDADVFVLPSNYEGIPMTLIEAMGTGLPIVATNVGGIPDMLVNNISAKIVNNNAEEVARAIEDIAISESTRKALGKKALEASTVFSAKEMCRAYSNIYEEKL